MPRLKNPRHEAFAQAQATGMSASDAYRATYGTNAKNIDSLSARLSVKVRKRVIQLQADSEHHTHLTISEKRSMYARESKDLRNKLRDRLQAMRDDSELSGHVKMAGHVEVNVNTTVSLSEERRAQLIAKKRQAIERRRARMNTPMAEHSGNGNSRN